MWRRLAVARHVDRNACVRILARQCCVTPFLFHSIKSFVPSRRDATTTAITKEGAESRVQLRSYQEECIQAVLKDLSTGEKRLGISLATGSGKTVIFSHLLDRVQPPTPDATQTLILAHRRELIDQAYHHCQRLYPNKRVEVEMAERTASGYADITLASVPTLGRSPHRLERFDPKRFKLLIVDEAHHIISGSYMTILDHFRLGSHQERGHTALVGVSATFARHDGRKLGHAIDRIVYHKDYVEMIEEDWLANAIFTTVRTGVNLNKVKVAGGDFQTASLSAAVNNEQANVITVRAWMAKAETRKSTLGFCVDVAHVFDLTAMFKQHGIDARFVTGSTKSCERAKLLASFRAREFPVLLNCGVFTEGTDIPNIDCILLARPTQSRNLLIQMLGRGLRKHEGKENCHVIDMVSSLEVGITTTPTLFGLDSDVDVQEAGLKEMMSMKKRKETEAIKAETETRTAETPPPELKGEVEITDYDNVNDLIEDTMAERHIRKMSPYAWVQSDENSYVLTNSDGAFVGIKKLGDTYHFTYTPKMPKDATSKVPFARPRPIGKAVTFESAVRGADTFASETFPFQTISKNARWRREPATENQLKFINKIRSKDEQLEPSSITKGRAGDLITKIKHGARGRFRRMQSARNVQKRVQKLQDRKKNQVVKVGPVER